MKFGVVHAVFSGKCLPPPIAKADRQRRDAGRDLAECAHVAKPAGKRSRIFNGDNRGTTLEHGAATNAEIRTEDRFNDPSVFCASGHRASSKSFCLLRLSIRKSTGRHGADPEIGSSCHNLHEDAATTVVLYRDQQAVRNFAFAKGEISEQSIRPLLEGIKELIVARK